MAGARVGEISILQGIVTGLAAVRTGAIFGNAFGFEDWKRLYDYKLSRFVKVLGVKNSCK